MKPIELPNFVELIKKRALKHPNRDCVIFLKDGDNNAVTMSYLENDYFARLVASNLQNRKINKGDRVLIMLPNSLEFVKIFFGCMYGGMLAVPLSEPASQENMDAYLETFLPTLKVSKPSLLIATTYMVNFLRNKLSNQLANVFSDLKIASDEEILSDNSREYSCPHIKENDTAYLQFTSGSTGSPKGIMIGHNNLMVNLEEARKFMQIEEKSGTAVWLPLFHDFGLAAGLMGSIFSGGFTVLMTPAHFIRKPLRWLKAISKFNCAHSYVPPFALDLCMKKISDEELKKLDLSCLISITEGSEPVHYYPTKKFIERFSECGLKSNVIRPGFGMAEIVIMFSGCKEGLKGLCVDRKLFETEGKIKMFREDSTDKDKKMLVNLGSQMDSHEIIITGDGNQPLPEGKVGELMISGPSVAKGYYKNASATKEIFHQNIQGKENLYLSTGDKAVIWNGDLYFAGRKKDIIIIRGRNYYPQDIEHVLSKIEELRPGCLMAFSSENENGSEYLSLGVEVRSDLIKNLEVFIKYILNSIDQKIIETVMKYFQITPIERLYLKPGSIRKTSSGKIKHLHNKKMFEQLNFTGLIKRVKSSSDKNLQNNDDKISTIEAELLSLFEKIISIPPNTNKPILDYGVDSVLIVELVDQIETKFSINLDIQDNTTLRDIEQQIKD